MDTILAEHGVRLSYLSEPSQREAFDPCRVLEDLYCDGRADAMLPWQNGLRMANSDHLVLATRADGRFVGALAASDQATRQEPFLFLDAAYLAPTVRTTNLLQRMLAFAMLRVAGNEAMPAVIAACVQSPCYLRHLRGFGAHFTGASSFPAGPEDIVIDLGMASLARRIARVVRPASRCDISGTACQAVGASDAGGTAQTMRETLVVIDLGPAHEATVLEEARRLYRPRAARGARRSAARTFDSVAAEPVQRELTAS